MSKRSPEIDVDDLARLMCQGFFNPWFDTDDDSSETQYAAYRAECHEIAANLLKPRAEALQLPPGPTAAARPPPPPSWPRSPAPCCCSPTPARSSR